MKILIAGFQHETNTFAPTKARYESFLRGEGFPALAEDEKVLALEDVNIAVGGFIQCAKARGHEFVPVIWAGASASAHVTTDAFERIGGKIVDAIRREKYDAIYLDLHGAMVTEDIDDGEGELLARIRAVIGFDIPVIVSLDLHANVTEKMLANASAMVAYRTYPHVDMADTGKAAWHLMEEIAVKKKRLLPKMRRVPFLIPVNGMCTLLDPAKRIYEMLDGLQEKYGVTSLSFAPGFPASDFEDCGPVVWGHGENEEALAAAVEELYGAVANVEPEWSVPFLSPREAVQEAIRIASQSSRPVIIADTQDNPGVGGDSNTTGMLRALVEADAQDAAIGLLWDADAVAAAHHAGEGKRITLSLGGQSGTPGDSAYVGEFLIERVGPGKCIFDGPMMNGVESDVGNIATLRIGGVRVVVSSHKSQMLDRNLFRMGGINPEEQKIVVVKSSVHFRADFQAIASEILVAKAPGPMKADSADLPWTKLRKGMRTSPNGKAFMPG
jgi:microcystin degradation protein MlrC